MIKFFLHIFDFLSQRRKLCLSLMTFVIVLLIAMMATLRYNENIFDFMPLSGNEQKALTLYQDISGGQRVYAMFKMKNGDTDSSDRLTEAVDTFANIIKTANSKHVSEITTQVDFEKVMGISDFVYQNMPLFLNESDYKRMDSLLSIPDVYEEQLANDVQMVMMPASGVLSSNISNDPLGLFTPVIERLQSHQSALPMAAPRFPGQ